MFLRLRLDLVSGILMRTRQSTRRIEARDSCLHWRGDVARKLQA